MSVWIRVALCLLLCVCVAPGQAAAQEGAATPSAEELWERYPLATTPEPATATPSRDALVRTAATSSPAAEGDSGGLATTDVVLLLLAAVIGATTVVLLERRRRSRRPASTRPARPARAKAGAPPDPALAWTAEIGWLEADGMARFQVIARTADGRDAIVFAVSPAFEWPPTGDGGVQALTAAADRLEAALLDAGWSSLAPGSAWYARRFGWEPVAAPSAPPRPAARLARARESDHAERSGAGSAGTGRRGHEPNG